VLFRSAPSFTWSVHHNPYHSDHFPILIQTGLPVAPPPQPTRWNLSKANWTAYQSSLKLPSTYLSPSEAWSVVEGRIKSAASNSVPRSAGHSKRKQTHHWWTTNCTKAFREKQIALHKYQRHQGNLELWIVYKKQRAIFIHITRTARKDCWMDFICSIFPCRPAHQKCGEPYADCDAHRDPLLSCLRMVAQSSLIQ
jgi:hypothetical protein